MIRTATLPLRGTRTSPLVLPFTVRGPDMTSADLQGYVLQNWDNDPVSPEIALPDGVGAGTTGIRKINSATVGGVIETYFELVIAEADMAAIPDAAEVGQDVRWKWYVNVTLSGGQQQRWIEGDFIVGGSQSGSGNLSSAVVTVADQTVVVTIDGVDLLAPLVAQAQAAAEAAEGALAPIQAEVDAFDASIADVPTRDYLARLGIPRRNLVDPDAVIVGSVVTAAGGLISLGGTFYATQPMSVVPGRQIVASGATVNAGGTYGWRFLDRNEDLVSAIPGTDANEPVDVPNDPAIAYAQTSFNEADVPKATLRIYNDALDNPDVPSTVSLGGYVAGLNLAKNLIENVEPTIGTLVRADGVLLNLGGTWAYSNLFSVQPGTTIASNRNTDLTGDGTYGWAFWGIEGNLVGSAPGTGPHEGVAVPDGAYFASTSIQWVDSGRRWVIYNMANPPGRLAGLNWMPWGDSITAAASGVYQEWVCTETGLTIPYQDARGGRRTDQLFEMFQVPGSPTMRGDPVNGVTTGGTLDPSLPDYSPSPFQNDPGPYPEAGMTLEEVLAPIDVVTILLGTNDALYGPFTSNIGTIADSASGSSYYSNLHRVVQSLLNAKNDLHLLWIISYPNIHLPSGSPIIAAQRAICEYYSLPVLDLFRDGGINSITRDVWLTGDQVHVTTPGNREIIGRRLAAALQAVL